MDRNQQIENLLQDVEATYEWVVDKLLERSSAIALFPEFSLARSQLAAIRAMREGQPEAKQNQSVPAETAPKWNQEIEAVLEAARDEWWPDRVPRDAGERALIEALADAYPDLTGYEDDEEDAA